jgi:hypothetical protein
MLGGAGVVRIVDDAGDTGIDTADSGEIVADIHVLRPIGLSEGEVCRVGIVGQRRRIWIDPAKLALP